MQESEKVQGVEKAQGGTKSDTKEQNIARYRERAYYGENEQQRCRAIDCDGESDRGEKKAKRRRAGFAASTHMLHMILSSVQLSDIQ